MFRDFGRGDPVWLSLPSQVERPIFVKRELGQGLSSLCPIGPLEVRLWRGDEAVRVNPFDLHDAPRIPERQWAQQDGIHNAEHGGVRANAEGERENRDSAEAWIRAK